MLLCFYLQRNDCFRWNMDNFKFSFPWRGQVESLQASFDKFFLTLFNMIPCHKDFFGNLIFTIIARMFCGNRLNQLGVKKDWINLLSKFAFQCLPNQWIWYLQFPYNCGTYYTQKTVIFTLLAEKQQNNGIKHYNYN